MQQRYSDYGTFQQLKMHNRILLGGERGDKKAYVLSNLDVCFENGIIDELQRDSGKAYWGWRTIARHAQGCHLSPVYGDRIDDDGECAVINDSLTEDGAVRETFIILCGLMGADWLAIVDMCCNDADIDHPLIIIQAFQSRPNAIAMAFRELEVMLHRARKIFEDRCDKAIDLITERA